MRQLCASTTGNNRIQPDWISLEQAESAWPWGHRVVWIIVYVSVDIL